MRLCLWLCLRPIWGTLRRLKKCTSARILVNNDTHELVTKLLRLWGHHAGRKAARRNCKSIWQESRQNCGFPHHFAAHHQHSSQKACSISFVLYESSNVWLNLIFGIKTRLDTVMLERIRMYLKHSEDSQYHHDDNRGGGKLAQVRRGAPRYSHNHLFRESESHNQYPGNLHAGLFPI